MIFIVCRELGIQCRPVTGYDAAHDSQGSLTIDIIKDEEGNTLEEFTRDSVWNYHVWNEVRFFLNLLKIITEYFKLFGILY